MINQVESLFDCIIVCKWKLGDQTKKAQWWYNYLQFPWFSLISNHNRFCQFCRFLSIFTCRCWISTLLWIHIWSTLTILLLSQYFISITTVHLNLHFIFTWYSIMRSLVAYNLTEVDLPLFGHPILLNKEPYLTISFESQIICWIKNGQG